MIGLKLTYKDERRGRTDIDLLWKRYIQTKDILLRNELVMKYYHLIEITASKMRHIFSQFTTFDDIVSNGSIALINAVEKFDPTKDVKFETYASIRIRGSVIDYIRGQDWVPRTIRDKARLIEDTFIELHETLGKEPTLNDLSVKLRISINDIEKILLETANGNILSFEEVVVNCQGYQFVDEENELPSSNLLDNELKQTLKTVIDSLSEQERLVVTLFYYEELKAKDIAYVMDITPSRVSQIHSMALIKMKSRLKRYMEI